MPLSMLDNLKLLLATKGVGADTSEAMIRDGLTLIRRLSGMLRSIALRNVAQEIAALTSSADILLKVAKSQAVPAEVVDDLESLALEILERVDAIVAEQNEDGDDENATENEPDDVNLDGNDPGITSPPASA